MNNIILKIFYCLKSVFIPRGVYNSMSYFDRDKKHEEIVAGWLEKYFYSQLNASVVNYMRVEEVSNADRIKEAQTLGIDLVLKDSNEEMYFIDEKSQTTYMNNPLPTFAFELSYEYNGVTRKGWLLDENKKTNYYLLIYPRSYTKESYKELSDIDDLDFAEIILLNKKRLITELSNIGISLKSLIEIAKNIQTENKPIPISDKSKNYVSIYKSSYLSEKPVNIVIKRTLLDTASSAIWEVHKNKIVEKKTFNKYWINN